MQFFEQLKDVFQARYPVLILNSHEHARIYRHLKAFCRDEEYTLFRWSCVEGLLELGLSFDTEIAVGDTVSDPEQVLMEIQRHVDERNNELFVMEGMFDFMHYPSVKAMIRKLVNDLPKSRGAKHVVLLNTGAEVPNSIARFVPALEVPLPVLEELETMLEEVARTNDAPLAEEARKVIASEALGMTELEANLAFQLVAVRTKFGIGSAEVIREAKSWNGKRE